MTQKAFLPPRLAMRTALAPILAFGCLGASETAMAQQTDGGSVFVDLGRWVVLEDPANRMCELRLTSDRQTIVRYFKRDGAPGSLRLQSRSGSFSSMFVGDVTWAFDDTQFSGRLTRNMYATSSDSSDIEAAFRRARFLTVNHAGRMVTRVSLQTSSAGFRLLNQCAQQWRFPNPFTTGTTIARSDRSGSGGGRTFTSAPARSAAPAPSVSTRRSVPQAQPPVTGPYPPNRPLEAINPNEWVRSEDISSRRNAGGVLRFTLMVDPSGRAEECIVNQSTGSRRFDGRLCGLLQSRARFTPASDASGNPTRSSYSSSIRFASE